MHFLTHCRSALMHLALIALPLAAFAEPIAAQSTGTVRGAVTSTAGAQPLVGAQVSIPGTGLGTLTNSAGEFLIAGVPAGNHTIRAQMVGYGVAETPVNVTADQSATVNLELSETSIALDELVVTGTAAAVRAKEVGTSLDAVTAAEIENVPVSNPQQILAGRVPGVTIMQNGGQAGAGGSIKIRGTNTISQNTEPLIYVDGVRIFNEPTRAGWGGRQATSPLQDIPAEDISRIEVVKGAAATTLYGTEASGGVVQIFTKKGIAGEPIWNAEVTTGLSQMGKVGPDGDPTNLFTQCGDASLLRGLDLTDNYGEPGRGDFITWVDPTCPEDGDWFESGLIQGYNLSVRGGSQNSTYFLSGNYSDDQGTLPTQGSKDGGLRGNFSFQPVDAVDVALSSAYTRRNTRWVNDGNNAAGFLLNVGRGYRGNLTGGKEGDCEGVAADFCKTNRYLFEGELYTRSDHFTTGLTVNYDPTDQLSNRFSVGWDYLDINNETTRPFGFLTTPSGYFWDENTRHTKLSLDYAGSFENNFGESLASTFSWGAQLFRDTHRWTEIDVENFAGPVDPTLETGAVISYVADNPFTETNAGVFLQELFGWQDRLFITAGLRVDGNSAFGENFGLQPYPKLSLAYVLSDYAFWPTDWFDTFKLRAAVGESGQAPGAFDKLRTWAAISGDERLPGFTPQEIGNPDVGPERTREIEAGFDASFFWGRLGLEATAYQATTFDALVPVTYPPSEGFLSSRVENVGEIRNRGIELQATAGLLRTDAIDWKLRGNVSLMSSEAIDLDGDPDKVTSIYTGLNSEIREGFGVPVYFGNRIVNPNDFADPIVVRDTVIGPVYPTAISGLGTTLTLMSRLTLDALAEYQGGHYVQNYTAYQNARRGVWYPCYGVQQKIIAADNGDGSALNDVTALERARCSIDDADSNFWIEPADFVKLRHVSLTYSLPAEWVRFGRNASITLAGQNLFTWTDYSGSDPEVQDAADQLGTGGPGGRFGRRDYYQLPNPRTFLLSFRLSF